ncbi:hypothetical protein T484DRAFT_1787557 [Baffinella frigidus]|nr:hypothetical protein T484DRAFT_1787557 [Cryptophyta sp. CCMP2293]
MTSLQRPRIHQGVAGFEGGELLFRGVRFQDADAGERAQKSIVHAPGVALIHLGQHLHQKSIVHAPGVALVHLGQHLHQERVVHAPGVALIHLGQHLHQERVVHAPGVALIHLGQHLHQAAPITAGIREDLILLSSCIPIH